jgi:hypothetical protein
MVNAEMFEPDPCRVFGNWESRRFGKGTVGREICKNQKSFLFRNGVDNDVRVKKE